MADVSNLQVDVQTTNIGVSNKPSKSEMENISPPTKKRAADVFADQGNEQTHKTVVITLADIKLRRQQMKVVNAMKEHHNAMSSLTHFGDSRIQTLVTDYMKPKSALRDRKLTDLEAAQLLVKPDPFQAEGQVNPNEYHFGHTLESYQHFIDEEQEKANKDIQRKLYVSEKKPLLRMPNLAKCGWMKCSGCSNLMINCHDVVFGAYCVYEVVNYCTSMQGYEITDIAVKKVFLDTYNRCLAFVLFKAKNKKVHDRWMFPPLCVQDNSYSYTLFWFEWIIQGLWGFPSDKEEVEEGDSGDEDQSEDEVEEV